MCGGVGRRNHHARIKRMGRDVARNYHEYEPCRCYFAEPLCAFNRAELDRLSDAIDRRAAQGPLGRRGY